jgi:hypothetical protein
VSGIACLHTDNLLTHNTVPMKASQILITMLAFIFGAAVVAGLGSLNKDDGAEQEAELADARAEIARLKERIGKKVVEPKFDSLPSAMPARTEKIAEATEEVAADANPSDGALRRSKPPQSGIGRSPR